MASEHVLGSGSLSWLLPLKTIKYFKIESKVPFNYLFFQLAISDAKFVSFIVFVLFFGAFEGF